MEGVRYYYLKNIFSNVSSNIFSDFILDMGVTQFLICKPLSYCFEETIGFDVKASFASRPVLRLIR